MYRFLILGIQVFIVAHLVGCNLRESEKTLSSDKKVVVLTYSSFLGKGSFGEWIKSEFERTNKGLEVEFVEASGAFGILGELNQGLAARRFDVVLGLDFIEAQRISSNPFDSLHNLSSSPMVIAIKKERITENMKRRKLTYNSWKELIDSKDLNGKLLIQDPRFSTPGFLWLVQSHVSSENLTKNFSKLVNRVFPSWSSSFAAFDQGEGDAIWTYASSISYYICNNKSPPIDFIRVNEGYVSSDETVGVLSSSKNKEASKKFVDFLLSDQSQAVMPQKNWVYQSSLTKSVMPECFIPKSKFPSFTKDLNFSSKQLNGWIDQWQLL